MHKTPNQFPERGLRCSFNAAESKQNDTKIVSNRQFFYVFVYVCLCTMRTVDFIIWDLKCAPLALHIHLAYSTHLLNNIHVIHSLFMYVDLFLDLVAKCISLSLSHIHDETLKYNENYYIIILHCCFSLVLSLSPLNLDSFCIAPAKPQIIFISETEQ